MRIPRKNPAVPDFLRCQRLQSADQAARPLSWIRFHENRAHAVAYSTAGVSFPMLEQRSASCKSSEHDPVNRKLKEVLEGMGDSERR